MKIKKNKLCVLGIKMENIDIQFFTIGVFGVNLSLMLRVTKP